MVSIPLQCVSICWWNLSIPSNIDLLILIFLLALFFFLRKFLHFTKEVSLCTSFLKISMLFLQVHFTSRVLLFWEWRHAHGISRTSNDRVLNLPCLRVMWLNLQCRCWGLAVTDRIETHSTKLIINSLSPLGDQCKLFVFFLTWFWGCFFLPQTPLSHMVHSLCNAAALLCTGFLVRGVC